MGAGSIGQWRKRRAAQKAAERVEPGNGRRLKPFRWWQPLGRVLFYLPVTTGDGRELTYAVDVHYLQRLATEDGKGKAHLYLDGRHHAVSKLPAGFPVEGGTIEVVPSQFGLRRCHYVTDAGAEHQLVPDPASAEGRRARLDREHPALGRAIGVGSVLVLLVGVALLVPQLLEVLTKIPPVVERFGTFTSPVDLSWQVNTALAVAFAFASTERSLRLRYHPLLDGAAN